jgi:heme-based aerotactic transducer
VSEIKISEQERGAVSGGRLTEQIGIGPGEINWRKDFTQFDEDDERNLEEMSHVFDEIADDLVEEFYDHIQSYSQSVAILDSSTKPVDALKKSQAEYLRDLGRGEYGQSYFDRRARIGKIHDMLDLGPKIYLGAYSVYYEGILRAIGDEAKADAGTEIDGDEADAVSAAVEDAVDQVVDQALSTLKLVNLDQQIAMAPTSTPTPNGSSRSWTASGRSSRTSNPRSTNSGRPPRRWLGDPARSATSPPIRPTA